MSLPQYTGSWTRTQAAHLLRRATFGPLKSEVNEAVSVGLSGTINLLFEDIPLPSPPVYYNYDDHPDANIGDTFIGLPRATVNAFIDRNARASSTKAWIFLTSSTPSANIREKMVFFWHNHFALSGQEAYNWTYHFFTRYRNFATGDFRELVKQMSVDPYMLKFLNGATSTANRPNENFPRELLELYTIGKGPQVGPGDYTNYTEEDIQELAKVFTGWTVWGDPEGRPSHPDVIDSFFKTEDHNTTTKQLSHRFNNSEIPNGEENEYAQAIDLIFQQDEVARFICRKLYRYFLSNDINELVEQVVIEPMAQILIDNDYVIAPVLQAFFKSAHFYQEGFVGCQIKSPFDYAHSLIRPMAWYDYFDESDVVNRYSLAHSIYKAIDTAGMPLLAPPDVAGWEAYYQVPSYDQLWVNTFTAEKRALFLQQCTIRDFRFPIMKYNWLGFLEDFDNPIDPNALIAEFGERFLTHPLHPEQAAFLKEELLPGLEDFVWSGEYGNYLANPQNAGIEAAVRQRLTRMVYAFLQLAEFYVQ